MKKFLVIMCCIAGLSFATAEVTAQRTVGNPSGEKKEKKKAKPAKTGTQPPKEKAEKKKSSSSSGKSSPKNSPAGSKAIEELRILVDKANIRITELEGEEESEVVTAMREELEEFRKMQNGEDITSENFKETLEKYVVSKETVWKNIAYKVDEMTPSGWDIFFRIFSILLFLAICFNYFKDWLNQQADRRLAEKMKKAGISD